MVTILVYERQRMFSIDAEVSVIRSVRRNVNDAYRQITGLSTISENVIGWRDMDYLHYRNCRQQVDSLLQMLTIYCCKYVQPTQIDSLRYLLLEKEMNLLNIMQTFRQLSKRDSLLINHLPEVARRATCVRTIKQKKDGIIGLFGVKETVQILPSASELHHFSDSMVRMQRKQVYELNVYNDSLRIRNKSLNIQLSNLIDNIDKQTKVALTEMDNKISEEKSISFRLFVIVTVSAIILLLLSFLIIRFDLCKEDKIKSKLKQVISENENLLEMRKKIILTVSHDIRGPLGNINNCADLASHTSVKKKREIYLDDIRHSCHHILHLVNNLMDAYRINEVGDLRNDSPFHLEQFLHRLSDEFSRKAIAKALILYSVHEHSDVTVKGDADKLEQVLANILTNAIKFTPSGSVNFHSKYLDGKLLVKIKDSGIGMDKETLSKIFVPFERAAQNINSEGFGLGLFLTKGLVKVLDGTIEVESEPGKGSVFKLSFPLPETDSVIEENVSDYSQVSILPKNVLIVDDDSILLKITEDMLGRKGIVCTCCRNAKEAIAAIGISEYDIVLTDLQMPGTDGFALLKLFRSSDIGNSRTIPIAIMTARGDGNTGIYEKDGFAGCIHKPFNIRSLLAFLSSVMLKEVHSDYGKFDFTALLKSSEDKGYILSLVVSESKIELDELEFAVKTTDRESMRKTVHRMIPIWEMLGKDCLLREFQNVLHNNDNSDEIVSKHAREIMEWVVKLIEETEKKLNKYENTDC